MRVAIVEDDKSSASDLQNFLKKYGDENKVTFTVDIFCDAVSFLKDLKPIYDMVFMDIDMPLINGMDAAKSLRQIDDKAVLIFVTNLSQFAIKGYEVNAFDFILKPVKYNSFAMRMERIAVMAAKASERYIMVPIAYGMIRLALSDLYFVEIRIHTLSFHTTRGVIETRGKLTEYVQILHKHDFLKCNKCYIVNVRHIQEIKDNTVIVGGKELQISRNRSRSFGIDVKKHLEKKVYGSEYYSTVKTKNDNETGELL